MAKWMSRKAKLTAHAMCADLSAKIMCCVDPDVDTFSQLFIGPTYSLRVWLCKFDILTHQATYSVFANRSPLKSSTQLNFKTTLVEVLKWVLIFDADTDTTKLVTIKTRLRHRRPTVRVWHMFIFTWMVCILRVKHMQWPFSISR